MYFDDNGLRFSDSRVRWLCPCGEGTGVLAGDEHPEDRVQWKVATLFNVLSERVSFREHVRKTHRQLVQGAETL